MTRGAFAGLLHVAEEGYRWDHSLELDAILEAGAARDPRDGKLKPRIPSDVYANPGPWLTEVASPGTTRMFRQYAPLAARELHRRFARLRRTERGILPFANRFGYLGHTLRPLKGQQLGPVSTGESLEFWRAEIAWMNMLIQVWDLVQTDSSNELSTFVHWRENPRSVSMNIVLAKGELNREATRRILYEAQSPTATMDKLGLELDLASGSIIAHEQLGTGDLLKRWALGDPLGPARYFVHREINAHLKGKVSPAVLPFLEGAIYFFPDSLLSALYVHFALEVSGTPRPRSLCARPGCGRYFHPHHGRQKFCSDQCRKLKWAHDRTDPAKGGHDG